MQDEEATRRLLRALGITDGTEDRVQADHSQLTTEQWQRAVYERHRYETGELTDWPDRVDLSDAERHVIGQMADGLLRLFRRVS